MRALELDGQVFGRLLVKGRIPASPGRSKWLCLCVCGKSIIVDGAKLRFGHTQSCGCLKRERTSKRRRIHGQANKTVEYHTWKRIKQRCTNPNSPDYPQWGGRGIVMCERWLNSFQAFFEDMGPRPPRHSIDRIDNDGPYSPENCRWAIKAVQANNTRINRYVIYNGERMTVSEAARAAGIKPATLSSRIHRGWPRSRWFEAFNCR